MRNNNKISINGNASLIRSNLYDTLNMSVLVNYDVSDDEDDATIHECQNVLDSSCIYQESSVTDTECSESNISLTGLSNPSHYRSQHDQSPHLQSHSQFPSQDPCNDFFGIYNDVSSSDSDSERPQKIRKKTDTSDGDISEGKSVQVQTRKEPNNSSLPTSDFWCGTKRIQYEWTEHVASLEKHHTSDNKANAFPKTINTPKSSQYNVNPSSKSNIGNSRNYTRKSDTICEKSSKKVFYVHHEIAPFLHQSKTNRSSSCIKAHIRGHVGAVNSVRWNSAQYSHLLLSSSMDQTVKLWNIFSKSHTTPLATYTCHNKAVKCAIWCSSGKQMVTASYDRTCCHLDAETGIYPSICTKDS